MASGNPNVILCERGIRTFEPSTRNTLDLSAVGVAKELSHLPVIVDPSHAAGRRDLIPSLSKAALAAGADGLLIEMHPKPEDAVSDGPQSLTPEQFTDLARELTAVAQAAERIFAGGTSEETLSSLRVKIDRIDTDLINLLAERMQVVKKIGEQKRLERIKDTGREKEILLRLVPMAEELRVPSELVKKVYALMFDYSVQSQIKNKLRENEEDVLSSGAGK